ncbi:DUF5919 domain-containing protein, partial [Streptomyces xanthochromogenes]
MEAPVLVLRGGGRRGVVRPGQDVEHGLFETYRAPCGGQPPRSRRSTAFRFHGR